MYDYTSAQRSSWKLAGEMITALQSRPVYRHGPTANGTFAGIPGSRQMARRLSLLICAANRVGERWRVSRFLAYRSLSYSLIMLRAYRVDWTVVDQSDASPAQPIQETADSVFHGGRKIALEPIQQAMRDQAVYVGRAYFKDHASISTLTAIPETRHSNRARTCAPAPFLCRFGRLKIARLLLFRIHAFSPRKDARMILSIPPPFNTATLLNGETSKDEDRYRIVSVG